MNRAAVIAALTMLASNPFEREEVREAAALRLAQLKQ